MRRNLVVHLQQAEERRGRDSEYAIAFMDDLRDRLANRVQPTTDGHKAYLEAVEGAFGVMWTTRPAYQDLRRRDRARKAMRRNTAPPNAQGPRSAVRIRNVRKKFQTDPLPAVRRLIDGRMGPS